MYQKLGDKEQAAAAMAQFQRLKTYEDQMHRFREALYTNPNVPVLYIKLGELHEAYDNLTEAAQIYEVATQVHPVLSASVPSPRRGIYQKTCP